MRDVFQVLGSVCILFSIIVANSSNNSFVQERVRSWQQIMSATHRAITNDLPVSEKDKGFRELIILLKSEDPDIEEENIQEIRKGAKNGIIFTNIGGVIPYQDFDIIYLDGSKKNVNVKSWFSKAFHLFLQKELLRYSRYLLLLGFILIVLSLVKLSALNLSVVKKYFCSVVNLLKKITSPFKLDQKEFKTYKTGVYVAITVLFSAALLTQCTQILSN